MGRASMRRPSAPLLRRGGSPPLSGYRLRQHSRCRNLVGSCLSSPTTSPLLFEPRLRQQSRRVFSSARSSFSSSSSASLHSSETSSLYRLDLKDIPTEASYEHISASLASTGCLLVKIDGSGVDPTILRHAQREAWHFFDLPEDQKREVSAPKVLGVSRGYVPIDSDELGLSTTKTRDLSEKFTVGANPFCDALEKERDDSTDEYFRKEMHHGRFFAENKWPRYPMNFEFHWKRYIYAMSNFCHDFLRILEAALQQPEGSLRDHRVRHFSEMRGINYVGKLRSSDTDRQLGLSPHRDFTAFTILANCIDEKGNQGPPYLKLAGTEASRRNSISSDWKIAPTEDGYFLVILGEVMEKWTSGKWLAPKHFVEVENKRRLTLAYFFNPAYDTILPRTRGEDRLGSFEGCALTVKEHWWSMHDRYLQK